MRSWLSIWFLTAAASAKSLFCVEGKYFSFRDNHEFRARFIKSLLWRLTRQWQWWIASHRVFPITLNESSWLFEQLRAVDEAMSREHLRHGVGQSRQDEHRAIVAPALIRHVLVVRKASMANQEAFRCLSGADEFFQTHEQKCAELAKRSY